MTKNISDLLFTGLVYHKNAPGIARLSENCHLIVTLCYLSEAKNLKHSKIQILRYAQNDEKVGIVLFHTACCSRLLKSPKLCHPESNEVE